jgi:hypothetical protein
MYVVLLIIIILILLHKKSHVIERYLPLYGYLVGTKGRLYSLLSDMKTVFSKHGIPYVVSGDVLLSMAEKGSLMRGQEHATVLIPQQYVEHLLTSTYDEFKLLGLGLSDLPDGGFLLSSSISLPSLTDTRISIYPIVPAGNKWITISKVLGFDEWYYAEHLFPARNYKLGSIEIAGPNNPMEYLHRNYWQLGIHADNFSKKRWYQLPDKLFKPHQIPTYKKFYIAPQLSDLDYVNGIMLDPRPIPGAKQIVTLGNGATAIVPDLGPDRVFPRKGPWRRYLWNG